jgi:hypothetical protein
MKESVLLSEVFTLTSPRSDGTDELSPLSDVSVNTSLSSTSFWKYCSSAVFSSSNNRLDFRLKHHSSSRRRLTSQYSGRSERLAIPVISAAPLIFHS